MGILIRLAVSAFTLWLATLVIPGITVGGTTGKKVLTLILVAIIFGVINAILRPIIKTIGCWAYLLTLGLISLVVNGALLLLTSYISDKINLPFHVAHFWPDAIFGALFIGVVSWLLNFLVPDGGDKKKKQGPPRNQQYPPQQYPPQQYPPQQQYPQRRPPQDGNW
jgi:putative membrane protein